MKGHQEFNEMLYRRNITCNCTTVTIIIVKVHCILVLDIMYLYFKQI